MKEKFSKYGDVLICDTINETVFTLIVANIDKKHKIFSDPTEIMADVRASFPNFKKINKMIFEPTMIILILTSE